MKFKWLIFLIPATALLLFSPACKKTEVVVTAPTVASLLCANVTYSTTATAGSSYTATASVPYTGGNGSVAYAAGSAIASTGVTGLSATLQASDLANGSGSLTYSISGTPSAAGTANFAISFGGQSCSIALTVSGGSSSSDPCNSTNTVAKIVCLAEAFKATLTAAQITTLQLDYTKANAIKWSNLPNRMVGRLGLQFSTLNATQLAAAKALVKAATGTGSNDGYDEVTQIWLADDLLNISGGGSDYGAGVYFIAFLGTPSTTGKWQLQCGGHHLAIATTFQNGAIASATPLHEAVEPKSWTANSVTYAPLAGEQTSMAAMLAALNSTQLAAAKLTATFSDIVLGPGKDGQFPTTKVGLQVSSLNATQKAAVLAAMKPWVLDTEDATAASLLAIYEKELDNTYIAYSGNATLAAQADYVRIDGPSVWIEFACQGGIVFRNEIHYHTIWRDHTRDYGANFTF